MKTKNQEPETQSNILGIVVGLMVGSLAGALTMLLMAPQSGKKTRKQIQEKSIELRDQANDMLDDAVKQVRLDGNKLSKRGRQKAKEVLHNSQALVTEQLEYVSDAVKAGKKAILST